MNNLALPKTQDTVQKSSRFRWLASVLIVLLVIAPAGIYSWRYLYNPCEVSAVEEASTFLVNQLNMYDAIYQVATAAPRTALPHPVNLLQQIFMDTQEIGVPACMETAKIELLNYMGTVISGFQAYRAGEADTTIRDLIRQSDAQYANFKAELKAVKKCAPFCAPWD